MARGKEWTVQEIEDIKRLKLIKRLSLKEIAEALGRSYASVMQKTFEIKFNTREYTEQDIKYLNKLIFKSNLTIKAIAGKLGRTEGALKKRMQGQYTRSNVHAKTGTLTGISSLAGYCTASNGHFLCFAIINQGLIHNSNGRAFQNKVCEILCAP